MHWVWGAYALDVGCICTGCGVHMHSLWVAYAPALGCIYLLRYLRPVVKKDSKLVTFSIPFPEGHQLCKETGTMDSLVE